MSSSGQLSREIPERASACGSANGRVHRSAAGGGHIPSAFEFHSGRWTVKRIALLAAAFSLLLAGCAVGPNYKRPQVTVPNQWTVAPARATSTKSPATEAWRSAFLDAQPDSLLARTLDRN